VSDDGRTALSLIAMLGNVFSPFYFAARRRGGGKADPLAHPAMNVALYTPGGNQWVLTERSTSAVTRDREALVLGPSAVRWDRDALVIDIEERTAPFGQRLSGRIRLTTNEIDARPTLLDAPGRHRWCPIAPAARAEVKLKHPSIRFSGHAYLDSNEGDEPLEEGFRFWTWSRVSSEKGTAITYDVERRDGSRLLVTRGFAPNGHRTDGFPVAAIPASRTMWRMPRVVHADPGGFARVARTLEDTPFYARSLVHTTLGGERAEGTHETLSLDRFRSRVVQFMLPYRMRREAD
jgi:carotenoid 1,2-hydratase